MNSLQCAKVAKICYRLDVGRTDGESITLGVVALLHAADGAEVPAVVCRGKLGDAEHAKMDWIAQQMLLDPARFFMQEIVDARKAGVADLFAHLSQKFAWSIYVAPPNEVLVPNQLVHDLCEVFGKLASDDDAQARRRGQESRIVAVRPSDPAAAALASIAGPEFPSADLVALLPPSWMIGDPLSASPQ
jgi:hypothetical protein